MKRVLDFLVDLRANNNREWFAANKGRYKEVEAIFNDFAEQLIAGIGEFDASVRGLTLRDCTYRIYRDTRFSHDKTPYKTHFGVYICPGGKKSGNAGYYFHIEPQERTGVNNHVDGADSHCVADGVGGKSGTDRSSTSNGKGGIDGKGNVAGGNGRTAQADRVESSASGLSGTAAGSGTVSWTAAEFGTISGTPANQNSSGKEWIETGGMVGGHLLDAGIYMPEPDVLKSVRDEIFDNGDEVLHAIERAGKVGFELDRSNSLKRTPTGYPTGNEWDDYLKLKDLHVTKFVDDGYILAPDLAARAAADFRATYDFTLLMNRAAQFAHEEK